MKQATIPEWGGRSLPTTRTSMRTRGLRSCRKVIQIHSKAVNKKSQMTDYGDGGSAG